MQPTFHEFLPGSQSYAKRYLKNFSRSQDCLRLFQNYWIKLVYLLFSKKKICIQSNDVKVAPFDKFTRFLNNLAIRNLNRNRAANFHNPNQSAGGLNNSFMLTNVFTCCIYFLEDIVSKPITIFPFQCLFMRDGYDFDETLQKMDRIGGSFTHLENELQSTLQAFKGFKLN